MILRRSRFVHQLPVGKDRLLIIHAVSQVRFPADREVGILLDFFTEVRRVPEDCAALPGLIPYAPDVIDRAIAGLVERQILTEKTPDEEMAEVADRLAPTHGRDPGDILERYRREMKEGATDYWSVAAAEKIGTIGAVGKRVDALLFGDCDIQMEADFLRREAAARGIDLHVSATFPDDVRFAAEHRHDLIFIGALRARHMLAEPPVPGQQAHATFVAQAHHMMTQLREKSSAPILIDNLPEPTVQPLGMAEQGLAGHRTRFRFADVALAELAAAMSDVYVVDVAAAMNAAGNATMNDDGLVGFTHFGSPGWLLQRPEREKEAVHGLFPDVVPLVQELDGDPYGREKVLSVAHIDAMVTVLGIGRKKCVIVDLDGTLWPGVLAETNAPFAWTPEISGAFSYIGLYFGLHEALLCLKKRGVVLACVSKNDEATVRELWKYPDNYPHGRLLTPDDFVTWRVNWDDKAHNIKSIADELGFALDAFLFIDDHPVERDRVRQKLPDVEVWGENPFELRRRLLTDPRLQLPAITEEAATRGELVKAQLGRQHLRGDLKDEASYIASLEIKCRIERPAADKLKRIEELFQRTTQFNSTGRKFTATELAILANAPNAALFAMEVSDRFGDYGLVGAAVIIDNDIVGLAVSCRALGMGVEHQFMRHIIAEMKKSAKMLSGKIIETPRNIPVRNIYRDSGFSESEAGVWRITF